MRFNQIVSALALACVVGLVGTGCDKNDEFTDDEWRQIKALEPLKGGPPPNPFVFTLADGPATKQTKGGKVQIADSTNFKVSTTMAAALVTVHPGGMREMHWHPNAD